MYRVTALSFLVFRELISIGWQSKQISLYFCQSRVETTHCRTHKFSFLFSFFPPTFIMLYMLQVAGLSLCSSNSSSCSSPTLYHSRGEQCFLNQRRGDPEIPPYRVEQCDHDTLPEYAGFHKVSGERPRECSEWRPMVALCGCTQHWEYRMANWLVRRVWWKLPRQHLHLT